MLWSSKFKLLMNDIEKNSIIQQYGSLEGKTMEDFFTDLSNLISIPSNDLKTLFKKEYSNETNWSF